MRKTSLILLVLLSATLARPARADMVWHDAYKSPMSDWGAYMYDQNVKRHLRERTSSPQGSSTTTSTTSATASAPAVPSAPITATDFLRSPNGKDVVAEFITASNLPPADGSKLATSLRSTMNQLGAAGRKDNVATAMTLLIGLCYGVLEKPGFDPSRANDLIPGVNDALAASPQFKNLGMVERQQMYDSMLLSASLIAIVHQSGDKQASQTIARQALAQLGLAI